MKVFFEALKAHIEQHPPNYGDGESIIESSIRSVSCAEIMSGLAL